ncbi:hypothetical protein BLOT_013100 [Blomia tropicalis]|nr:hypothetical protein BLOT_013100 [Blomia tropicalis]
MSADEAAATSKVCTKRNNVRTNVIKCEYDKHVNNADRHKPQLLEHEQQHPQLQPPQIPSSAQHSH